MRIQVLLVSAVLLISCKQGEEKCQAAKNAAHDAWLLVATDLRKQSTALTAKNTTTTTLDDANAMISSAQAQLTTLSTTCLTARSLEQTPGNPKNTTSVERHVREVMEATDAAVKAATDLGKQAGEGDKMTAAISTVENARGEVKQAGSSLVKIKPAAKKLADALCDLTRLGNMVGEEFARKTHDVGLKRQEEGKNLALQIEALEKRAQDAEFAARQIQHGKRAPAPAVSDDATKHALKLTDDAVKACP